MQHFRKIKISTGIWWVELPALDIRILCGCPADAVKHLMKRGLIAPVERHGRVFETGPNMILLSDLMIQNGTFSNLSEFPVLQMLYNQGMIIPDHPGNTGIKPMILGSAEQVRAQLNYIYRGNYGLISEAEMIEAGANAAEARDRMRLKERFAFGKIQSPEALIDTLEIDTQPVMIRDGLEICRTGPNNFRFSYDGEHASVDLNLSPFEIYECPYPLGFYHMPREYFAVVHSGEGDGWDINRPCMGAILMFQGRVYLVDAGPNILQTLDALGIGVNEVEGIFHTHSHDDHFAGLTTLIRADHRLKYFASPFVLASVSRKVAALLGTDPSIFHEYFDCVPLAEGVWTDIDGLEVMPQFSPHPVETTTFMFRALWEGGYRTYAHMADICRIEVLKTFIEDDVQKPGLSQAMFDQVVAGYKLPADVKKLDVGGGLIHGDAMDFKDDPSKRLILAHTSSTFSVEQRAIGETASFGTVDVLIPSNHDFIWRSAFELLSGYFPHIAHHQVRVLLNNPVVTFSPGNFLIKEGQDIKNIYLVLSGSVEVLASQTGSRSVLSAGAMVGELSVLPRLQAPHTCRAVGFVKALQIPVTLYEAFVSRNHLKDQIQRLFEYRSFLQRTWLFGEVVSTRSLNRIALEITPEWVPAGDTVDVGSEYVGVIVQGALQRQMGDQVVETLEVGDFFGEDMSVNWLPARLTLTAAQETVYYKIPASLVRQIPQVRWKLFEASGKRLSSALDKSAELRGLLQWQDRYQLGLPKLDSHHRRMFEQANAIMDAVDSARVGGHIAAMLDDLSEYARFHFQEEEAQMEKATGIDVASHHELHQVMLRQIAQLAAEIRPLVHVEQARLKTFLHEWLTSHIEVDRGFAAKLSKRPHKIKEGQRADFR